MLRSTTDDSIRPAVAGGWSDRSAAGSVWPPEVSLVGGRRTIRVRECAVIADQLWLREGGRLLVAILRCGHERLERRQLLQRAGYGAFIGVQVYELARVGQLEDRVAKSRRSPLREFLKDGAHDRSVLLLTSPLHRVGDHRMTHCRLLVRRWGGGCCFGGGHVCLLLFGVCGGLVWSVRAGQCGRRLADRGLGHGLGQLVAADEREDRWD